LAKDQVNPDAPAPRTEAPPAKSAFFLRHRRKMQIGGGIAFAVLALWMNSLTAVNSDPPAAHAAPHATPTFLDGFALIVILNLVAVAFAIAAFRGSLRLLPGIAAFAILVGAALAVCYYR